MAENIKMQNLEQFRQTAPHKLELKKGGGCVGCFGLPFFLAGLFMLLMGAQLIPVSNASDLPWWSWIIIIGMGLVFSTVGAALVFGRKWITLDVSAGRIWIAWGLLRPMWGNNHYLKDYNSVLLKYVQGDSDTADSYEIVLKARNESELSLLNCQDYGVAHAQTLLLSGFLKLPGEDRSTDHKVLFKPEDAIQKQDEPVFTREINIVSPPPDMKSKITLNGSEVVISIPHPRYSPFNLLELIIPVGIATVFGRNILPFFDRTQTPAQVQLFFGGFIGLFFVLMPLISVVKRYLLSKRFFLVVTVNADGINLKWHKKTKTITKDMLIALDYGTTETALQGLAYVPAWAGKLHRFARSKGVIIKSKDGFFYVGAGLADDEVVYLYSLIKQFLMN